MSVDQPTDLWATTAVIEIGKNEIEEMKSAIYEIN
jgi:hypothetical protein